MILERLQIDTEHTGTIRGGRRPLKGWQRMERRACVRELQSSLIQDNASLCLPVRREGCGMHPVCRAPESMSLGDSLQ